MPTFALIHGAWHGRWCWEHLAALLEGEGARAVAPDLPCEDLEAGNGRYADVVAEALQGSEPPVIVVAHSLGGLTAPLVCERVPVARLVFLCGHLPNPGVSLAEELQSIPGLMAVPPVERDADDRSFWPAEAAIELMYADCDRDDALQAVSKLRHQAPLPSREPSPLRAWPDVPSTYVLATEDRLMGVDRWRELVPERLGVDPIEIPGGHSPWLSRPGHVAEILLGLAHSM